jgi:hypothetical protein
MFWFHVFAPIKTSLTLRRVTSLELKKVRDEMGDLVTDFHIILGRWGNRFSQLLNLYGVSDVRQREIQTAESPVSDPSAF